MKLKELSTLTVNSLPAALGASQEESLPPFADPGAGEAESPDTQLPISQGRKSILVLSLRSSPGKVLSISHRECEIDKSLSGGEPSFWFSSGKIGYFLCMRAKNEFFHRKFQFREKDIFNRKNHSDEKFSTSSLTAVHMLTAVQKLVFLLSPIPPQVKISVFISWEQPNDACASIPGTTFQLASIKLGLLGM